jgi:hypothetical protein
MDGVCKALVQGDPWRLPAPLVIPRLCFGGVMRRAAHSRRRPLDRTRVCGAGS